MMELTLQVLKRNPWSIQLMHHQNQTWHPSILTTVRTHTHTHSPQCTHTHSHTHTHTHTETYSCASMSMGASFAVFPPALEECSLLSLVCSLFQSSSSLLASDTRHEWRWLFINTTSPRSHFHSHQ
ncbi:hypothetical protein AALO_G00013260 [Alosa alosa]|uniref:Uncharacterized protein n=1 Tax=Alosa alosa TaxID=278164 RepID=A0AAV6HK31_9TELE|nr:hypothetical protein AALO_G00013260 [Alosa alosa]